MHLIIDGTEELLDSSGIGNFAALMEAVYRKTADVGRVACRVLVDGEELTPVAEKERAAASVCDVTEVRVTTSSPDELMRDGLEGAKALDEAIRHDIEKAVASFRAGDAEAGNSHYLACVKSLGTFFAITEGILDGIRGGFFPAPEGTAASVLPPSGETADVFRRLLEYQQCQDWLAMADMLEYEVTPNLRDWTAFLEGQRVP